VNHISVAKRRSPRRAAQSKARRSEPDEDLSPADSGDEEQVSGGTEHSPDDSNYSDDESVTSHSKEEGGEEEDEVEDAEDNPKGILSTPVSRKGPVLSDYDTPIADLLRDNRTRQPERNVTKRVPKSSQRKQTGGHDKKRNTDALSNDNNEGALFNCCCFDHMLFCFLGFDHMLFCLLVP
jgi:hypothetical protein